MVDIARRQRTTFPDARESYIRETHEFNSPTNVINRELQRSNDLQRAYEGRTVPQRFPDWVTRNPNASEMINEWQMPGGGSWMGSPMWMDAGITNRNLGGAKVWNALSIDPTADDFFLKELYNYGKRFLPGYDAEQDEWRHKRYMDNLEMDETEYIDELPISPLIENPDQIRDDEMLMKLYDEYYESGAEGDPGLTLQELQRLQELQEQKIIEQLELKLGMRYNI